MTLYPDEPFISTGEAAELTGTDRTTAFRWASENPNFAVRVGEKWKIPLSHVQRVLAGESIESVCTNPAPVLRAALGAVDVPADTTLGADEPAPLAQEGPDLFSDAPEVAVATDMADTVAPDADQDELRHRMLRAYLFALGLRQHDAELSDAKRQSLAWSVSEDLLATIRTLGIVPTGGLKTALRNSGVLREYRALTGIDTEI